MKTAHRNGYKFIIIIDEENQNNTSKANDIITAISAITKSGYLLPCKRAIGEFYKIDEVDVINEELITRAMYINYELDVENIDDISSETDLLIEKADELEKYSESL